MSARTFIDTNVLVYAVDDAEPQKRDIARKTLGGVDPSTLVLSTQVLSEFYVTVTRKLAKPMSDAQAAAAVDWLSQLTVVSIDTSLVKDAISTCRDSQISFWDGLVVATATRSDCERLLSEDLNDGQTLGSVRVEDPFTAAV